MKKDVKVCIFLNNTDWESIDLKTKTIRNFFEPKFNLIIDVVHTGFLKVPFTTVSSMNGVNGTDVATNSEIVDNKWYDENIMTLAGGYDIVLLYLPKSDTVGHFPPIGIRTDCEQGATQLSIYNVEEYDQSYFSNVHLGNSFVVYACHEISHALFMMFGLPDTTHKHFYSTTPEKVISDYNVSTIGYISSILNRVIRSLAYMVGYTIPKMEKEGTLVSPLKWDNRQECIESFYKICKEEGVNADDTELLRKVINCESGFNPKAKLVNKNGTTDWGICQYNDYWYIGEGKPIASVDEAVNNPEKCIRVMIQQFRAGRLKDWVCYSAGKYLNY